MNMYSLLATVASCIYLALGLYILILDKKSLIHRLFFYMCFTLFMFSGCAVFAYSAENGMILTFWLKITLIAAFIHYPTALHFCIEISKITKQNKWFYLILYIPSLIFIFKEISYKTSTVFLFIKFNNYWEFVIKKDIWSFLIFSTLYLYLFICLIILFLWDKKANTKKEKAQSKILFYSLLIRIIASVSEIYLIPIITSRKTNLLVPLFYLIWIAAILYAVIKYKFLSITPELVSNDIIKNIDEAIILLDQNRKVITVNEKTKSILGEDVYKRDKLIEKITNFDEVEDKINSLLNGDLIEFNDRLQITVNEEKKVLMDIKCSLVKDKFDDILGVLIIGKEVRGVEQLKKVHKITDREFDIILQIISGSSNKDIGVQLGITLNTMKRHITNVYNKLAVNNKVELMNLLKDYDILN